MIPYGKQDINQEDVNAVLETLRSDFLTQGPKVPEFESSLCSVTGARHAVAVNSATSALHLACLALGVKTGDLVWTSPNSFVASANCALYCGADVDFIDIDPGTRNMSVEALRAKLLAAKSLGRLPKVVIPVHFAGMSCDMKAIWELSREFNFSIIEDASHAVGASYEGTPVGACAYSDICVFSFHPVKIITTMEGGAALTNDPQLARQLSLLRSHGITRDAGTMESEPHGAWYYEQLGLGFNYRMTDIQAALGLSQLTRLAEFVDLRNKLAGDYSELLGGLPVRLPELSGGDYRSSFHLYVIEVEHSLRKTVFDHLRRKGIGVNVHYIPIYMQPIYRRHGYSSCPEAEKYYWGALSLPMYPGLRRSEAEFVRDCLREIVG